MEIEISRTTALLAIPAIITLTLLAVNYKAVTEHFRNEWKFWSILFLVFGGCISLAFGGISAYHDAYWYGDDGQPVLQGPWEDLYRHVAEADSTEAQVLLIEEFGAHCRRNSWGINTLSLEGFDLLCSEVDERYDDTYRLQERIGKAIGRFIVMPSIETDLETQINISNGIKE